MDLTGNESMQLGENRGVRTYWKERVRFRPQHPGFSTFVRSLLQLDF